MDSEVAVILPRLIEAIETVMSPNSDQQARMKAYQACEEFKETSPHCVQCGLKMAEKGNPHIIRHFGLQLMEHCIKYRWNNLNPPEKVFIKNNAMNLMAFGTEDLLVEAAHIKDALSRIVVEMIKRSWPQHWPSMLSEFAELCTMGRSQTELVLLVFLRLAEDAVVFQNMPHQRRREIMQTLQSKTNMDEIFSFFLNTLAQSFQIYRNKNDNVSATEKAAACQVTAVVLRTLTVYLDWISMSYVFHDNNVLLQMLCLLLDDQHLQLPAVECLLTVINRKGKLDERKPLLMLFSEDAMSAILNAAEKTANGTLDEQHYLFFKRLCQVLAGIGSQLCALWGSDQVEVGQPPNFQKYLSAILAFTKHPSQAVSSITQNLWISFLRHEHVCKDPVLVSFIPHIIASTKLTLSKVGFPSQDNSASCYYSRLDNDSDEDFNMFFSRFRSEVRAIISRATHLCPDVAFLFGAQWLTEHLSKDSNKEGLNSEPCSLRSNRYLEWEALNAYLESLMSQYVITDGPKPGVQEGISLLKSVLNYQTQDATILSCVLSCLSTLFIFLTDAQNLLPAVLQKIFSAAVFNIEGQTKGTRSKPVKNVRRHACSILVKVCKQYAVLLLPGFDELYGHIRQISSDPEQLSQMEKCTLLEALIIVSNEFKDFNRQSAFVNDILSPLREIWTSAEMTEAVSQPGKFLAFVGLDKMPVEPSSADTCGINRSQMLYCVNTILAVMKRCKWPEDMSEAKAGGFVKEECGMVFTLNPATPHTLDLFSQVLSLIRTMNACWLPEYLNLRHPEYSKSYDLQEAEKLTVLGIVPRHIENPDSVTCQKPLDRMQSFIHTIHDNSCHILGNAGVCLGAQFYSSQGLAMSLINTVFTHLDHIPDYRIKPIIRVFMKLFVQYCPKECYTNTLFPVLSVLFPYMLQRLSKKWQDMQQRCVESGTKEEEEVNTESQEVLDDHLTRQLTKEYIDLISLICHSKKGASVENSEDVMMDEETVNVSTHSKEESLSELGQELSKYEDIFSPMVLCVFNALTWSDTNTCNKCTGLCWLMVKQLVQEKKVTSEDAGHLYMLVLLGLQQHGQHEGSQSLLLALALQMYELMCPLFPDVRKVLEQVPNLNASDLKTFDHKLFSTQVQKPFTEKKRKESFKKLVEGIIGKNVGQQFRREVHIKNLPPLCVKSRPKSQPLDETEKRDLGLCSLFQPNNNAS